MLSFILRFVLLVFSTSVGMAQYNWEVTNPSPTAEALHDLSAGPEGFIAVGTGGVLLHSSTATEWRESMMGTQETFGRVEQLGGKWYARGHSGSIFISENGEVWKQSVNLGGDGPIAYGNGKVIALNGEASIWNSNQGTDWAAIVLPADSNDLVPIPQDVVFDSKQFWLNSTSGKLYKSMDGENWEYAADSYGRSFLVDLAGGNQLLLSVARRWNNPTKLVVERIDEDGGFSEMEAPPAPRGIVFVNSQFLLKTTSGLFGTTDGISWQSFGVPDFEIVLDSIAHNDGLWAALDDEGAIYESTDLTTWRPRSKMISFGHAGVVQFDDRFLTNDGLWSMDGKNWSAGGFIPPELSDSAGYRLNIANGILFALVSDLSKPADEQFQIWRSTDGVVAEKVFSGEPSTSLGRILYANGTYVLIAFKGMDPLPIVSSDGIKWIEHERFPPDESRPNYSLATVGDRFWASDFFGQIFSSEDGLTWEHEFTSAYGIEVSSFCVGPGFIFFGTRGANGENGSGYYLRGEDLVWNYHLGYRFRAAFHDGNTIVALGRDPGGQHGIFTLLEDETWSQKRLRLNSAHPFVSFARTEEVSLMMADNLVVRSRRDESLIIQRGLRPRYDVVVDEPKTLQVSVSSTTNRPVDYQWSMNGVDLAGETRDSLTVPLSGNLGGSRFRYAVRVTDGESETFSSSWVDFYAQPQPEFREVDTVVHRSFYDVGDASFGIHLSAPANGPGDIMYTWYKSGERIQTGHVPDLFSVLGADDLGQKITVVASNGGGAIESRGFVIPAPVPEVGEISLNQLKNAPGGVLNMRLRFSRANLVQWRQNGRVRDEKYTPFQTSGYTDFELSPLQVDDGGFYDVLVSNSWGSITVPSQFVSVTEGWLSNLSVRSWAGSGDATVVPGLTLQVYDWTSPPLVRAVGPSLGGFGVVQPLTDPFVSVLDSDGSLLGLNDQWGTDNPDLIDVFSEVGAFPLTSGSKDAAILVNLNSVDYGTTSVTIPVASQSGEDGEVLTEVYLRRSSNPHRISNRLINVSCRAEVGADKPMVAGFVVAGEGPVKLLIRAAGPALADFGVSGILVNPRMILHNASGEEIGNNDSWHAAGNVEDLRKFSALAGAFTFPEDSNDAAMLVTLQPGVYTVQIEGVAGASGISLIELYEVP